MMQRKYLHIKWMGNQTLRITVPGKWREFGQSSLWTWNSRLIHTYKLGFAEISLFTPGGGVTKQEQEAMRQAQQPFTLLRPASEPMADKGISE